MASLSHSSASVYIDSHSVGLVCRFPFLILETVDFLDVADKVVSHCVLKRLQFSLGGILQKHLNFSLLKQGWQQDNMVAVTIQCHKFKK